MMAFLSRKNLDVQALFEKARLKPREAQAEADKIKRIKFREAQEMIIQLATFPASPTQRSVFKSLIFKLPAGEVSKNLAWIMQTVAKYPKSQGVAMALIDKLKFIDYDQALSALKYSVGSDSVKVAYFFQSLALKSHLKPLAYKMPELLNYLGEEPRAFEGVQALLLHLPARYLPKPQEINQIFKDSGSKAFALRLKLLRKKKLGDKGFHQRSFIKTFKSDLKVRLGENRHVTPSLHAYGVAFQFGEIIRTPFGHAVCAGFDHGYPLFVLPGDYHATIFDNVPPVDYRKCGIKKVGRL